MIDRLRGRIEGALWALLILLLPLTSLPWLSRLSGGAMVAPAAVIPAILLIIIFFLPLLLRGGRLPRHVLPILGLFLAAAFSSALSFFLDISLYREVNRLSNSASALVTLGIGLTFYLLAASWTDTTSKLTRLYFWANVSGLVVILWCIVQAAAWYSNQAYPEWMLSVQRLISSSGLLYDRRVTGLAFEPSWLGHQLVLLYLPYWLAATVRRTSAHPFRLLGFSAENGLLILGAGMLLLAFSRSAIISFMLMIGLLLLRFSSKMIESIRVKILRSRNGAKASHISSRLVNLAVWAGTILVFAVLLAGIAFALTRLDPRMTDLFALLKQRLSFTELSYKLIFGERVVFWNAGLDIFGDHPVFGVGLANAGFFIPEKLTPFGWTVAEPFKMYYSNTIPNTLSLWVRLLAETGILGFAIMAAWLLVLWNSGRYALAQSNPTISTAGLAGQLALAALLMEGMSVDTFAFPYFWLTFGWLTAAVEIAARSERSGHGQRAG